MAAKMSSATADDAGPAALAQARGERGAAGAAGVSVAADRAVMVERPVVVERVVEKVVAQEALAKSVAAAPASAAADPRAVIQELATSDRQVIRNGTLALVVVDLERAVASIGDVLASISGGLCGQFRDQAGAGPPAFRHDPAYSGRGVSIRRWPPSRRWPSRCSRSKRTPKTSPRNTPTSASGYGTWKRPSDSCWSSSSVRRKWKIF